MLFQVFAHPQEACPVCAVFCSLSKGKTQAVRLGPAPAIPSKGYILLFLKGNVSTEVSDGFCAGTLCCKSPTVGVLACSADTLLSGSERCL